MTAATIATSDAVIAVAPAVVEALVISVASAAATMPVIIKTKMRCVRRRHATERGAHEQVADGELVAGVQRVKECDARGERRMENVLLLGFLRLQLRR